MRLVRYTELTRALRAKYGVENVVASGRRLPPRDLLDTCAGPATVVDVMDRQQLNDVVREYRVNTLVVETLKLEVNSWHS